MQKTFFTSRGLKLCGLLEVHNLKSREIVVTVHGYSSGKDSSTWVKMASELGKKSFNVFRFDLPGGGESEGNFAEQTISTMVQDTLSAIEFLKKKGFQKFYLVGSSAGGLVCMVVASKIKIEKIALIAPVSNYLLPRIQKYGERGISEWRENGYNFYDSGKRGLLKVNYSFFEDLQNYQQMPAVVAKIKCPVLIVHGDKDESVLLSDSEEIVKHFPNARLMVMAGCGHHFEEPFKTKAVKLIVNWLAIC